MTDRFELMLALKERCQELGWKLAEYDHKGSVDHGTEEETVEFTIWVTRDLGEEIADDGSTAPEVAALAEDDPVPVFILAADDICASWGVEQYRSRCQGLGLQWQADQVFLTAQEFKDWQARHPDMIRVPHHPHVPAKPTSD